MKHTETDANEKSANDPKSNALYRITQRAAWIAHASAVRTGKVLGRIAERIGMK